MDQTVFITREQGPASPFTRRLEAAGWRVYGRSLLQHTAVRFTEVPGCDWIFCYSPRAVGFFLDQLTDRPVARWAAIGPGTAKALEAQGVVPDFVGDGDPDSTAMAFLKEAAGQRVLFPRARHSRQSVQRALGAEITSLDLIVYDNQPRADFAVPPCRVLVFTSPLNARAYFGRYTLQEGQRVVAIGPSTAVTLSDLGVIFDTVAAEPSEEGLATAVLQEFS
ncbi:MAG: uroporphyrinogen-III synthase [Lewinella sp.]|nr:uroporphyrinogen-III synthase [Lewinella sp.]